MLGIFLKLLNMSITAGWIVLAVVVLRVALKKAPKRLTCLLWLLVALRLVCPISIESSFSLIPTAQTIDPAVVSVVGSHGDEAPIPDGAVDPVYDGIASAVPDGAANAALDNTANVVPDSSANVVPDSSANVIPDGVASVVPDGAASAVPSIADVAPGEDVPSFASDGGERIVRIFDIAAIVWIVGAALMLTYALVTTLRIRAKLETAVRLRDNIFQSERIDYSFAFGVFRPRIYLPFDLDERIAVHVIAHEKTHLRRLDHITKPLGFILLSVNWYNPLMWVAYVLFCKDIELASDESVVRELESSERADYSEALLRCSEPKTKISVLPIAFGVVGVKERVRKILGYKKPSVTIIAFALVCCIVMSVCLLTDPKALSPDIPDDVTNEQMPQNDTVDAVVTDAETDADVTIETETEAIDTEPVCTESAEPETEPIVTDIESDATDTEAIPADTEVSCAEQSPSDEVNDGASSSAPEASPATKPNSSASKPNSSAAKPSSSASASNTKPASKPSVSENTSSPAGDASSATAKPTAPSGDTVGSSGLALSIETSIKKAYANRGGMLRITTGSRLNLKPEDVVIDRVYGNYNGVIILEMHHKSFAPIPKMGVEIRGYKIPFFNGREIYVYKKGNIYCLDEIPYKLVTDEMLEDLVRQCPAVPKAPSDLRCEPSEEMNDMIMSAFSTQNAHLKERPYMMFRGECYSARYICTLGDVVVFEPYDNDDCSVGREIVAGYVIGHPNNAKYYLMKDGQVVYGLQKALDLGWIDEADIAYLCQNSWIHGVACGFMSFEAQFTVDDPSIYIKKP